MFQYSWFILKKITISNIVGSICFLLSVRIYLVILQSRFTSATDPNTQDKSTYSSVLFYNASLFRLAIHLAMLINSFSVLFAPSSIFTFLKQLTTILSSSSSSLAFPSCSFITPDSKDGFGKISAS